MEETAMTAFFTALNGALTADALWAAVTPWVATVVVVLLFAFGLRFFRRLISGASRGKVKTV